MGKCHSKVNRKVDVLINYDKINVEIYISKINNMEKLIDEDIINITKMSEQDKMKIILTYSNYFTYIYELLNKL
jgi:hypothetical protein